MTTMGNMKYYTLYLNTLLIHLSHAGMLKDDAFTSGSCGNGLVYVIAFYLYLFILKCTVVNNRIVYKSLTAFKRYSMADVHIVWAILYCKSK
jgi:hypothetical protein